MGKLLIACCLLGLMRFTSAAPGTLWWQANLGISDIITDLETRDRLLKLPGRESNAFTLGAASVYQYDPRSKYTLRYGYRRQKNDDQGSANFRGRTIRTSMHEIGLGAQYNLLAYFLDVKLPVELYGGGGVSFYLSWHRFTVDPYYGYHPSDNYRTPSHGVVLWLNMELDYPINEYMQAGLSASYGHGGNDYLEGYTTTNSSYNDDLVAYSLVFNYRFGQKLLNTGSSSTTDNK